MVAAKFHLHSNTEIVKVLMTSVLGYVLLLSAAFYLSEFSFLWVLLLAVPTHFLHARIFIVMHDCGHRSFFKSRFLNSFFGHITAFSFYTPFLMWRELHNKHHANQGNLDRRHQSLDVWTLTRSEYDAAGLLRKLSYRLYRHPFFLFLVAPFFFFLLIFRVPFERFSKKAVFNIFSLDLLLLGLYFSSPALFLKIFLIQLPSLSIGLPMAAFLFYIQHQFENTLWVRNVDFNSSLIARHGSSFYKVPDFLNWAYGNIGYHHLHHLDVRIPMYNLPHAQQELQLEHSVVELRDTLKCLQLKLWDEKVRKMVGF